MRAFRNQINITSLLGSHYQRAVSRTFPSIPTSLPTSVFSTPQQQQNQQATTTNATANNAIRIVVTQCPKTVYGDYQSATAISIAKKMDQQPAQVAQVS